MVGNQVKFIHVPKTAGTALKSAKKNLQKLPFSVCSSHNQTLYTLTQDDVAFALRDPLQRFCSGYWTRKNHYLREQLAKLPNNAKYKISHYNHKFTSLEQLVFSQCNTPDEYATLLQQKPELMSKLNTGNLTKHVPLGLLTVHPLTDWLGNVEKYRTQEHRVRYALDHSNLTHIMKHHFSVNMPEDDFQARRHTQFDVPQSYHISEQNTQFLIDHLFAADYELISYITTQSYYIGN